MAITKQTSQSTNSSTPAKKPKFKNVFNGSKYSEVIHQPLNFDERVGITINFVPQNEKSFGFTDYFAKKFKQGLDTAFQNALLSENPQCSTRQRGECERIIGGLKNMMKVELRTMDNVNPKADIVFVFAKGHRVGHVLTNKTINKAKKIAEQYENRVWVNDSDEGDTRSIIRGENRYESGILFKSGRSSFVLSMYMNDIEKSKAGPTMANKNVGTVVEMMKLIREVVETKNVIGIKKGAEWKKTKQFLSKHYGKIVIGVVGLMAASMGVYYYGVPDVTGYVADRVGRAVANVVVNGSDPISAVAQQAIGSVGDGLYQAEVASGIQQMARQVVEEEDLLEAVLQGASRLYQV